MVGAVLAPVLPATTVAAAGRSVANRVPAAIDTSDGVPAAIDTVACPTAARCVAVAGPDGVEVGGAGGATWRAGGLPGGARPYGVACPSADRCVAVGDDGAILTTVDGGRDWTRERSPTTQPLASVACPTTDLCLAGGEDGTVVRSTDGGRRWRPVAVGRTDTIEGVACPTATHCVAVGGLPDVSVSDDGGVHWRLVTTAVLPLVGMRSVACASPTWCVAAGTYAVALSTTDGGDDWQDAIVPVSGELHGVACTATDCLAVGGGGQVATEASPGGGWVVRSTGTDEMLLGVTCTGSQCVAVGGGGTVVRSEDGGVDWTVVAGRSDPTDPTDPTDPVPVLFAGDSASYTLADGLAHQAAAYGLSVVNDGLFGCGLLRGGPILVAGQPQAVTGPCAATGTGWPSIYRSAVADGHPGVAVLLLGRWDLMDRRHDGRWIWPGSPGYAADFLGELHQAIDVLSAGGAKVVVLTTPVVGPSTRPARGSGRDVCRLDGRPMWCEDLPQRAAAVNHLLRQGVADSGGRAAVVDLGARVNPAATFVRRVDGVTVRLSDGIHFATPGTDWLAPWLLPRLASWTASPADDSTGR